MSDSATDGPLLEALAAYETALDAGRADRAAFLASLPHLAGRLAPLLDAAERVEAVARPFRLALRRDPAPPDLEGYELLGVLGRGGMGVVYKARQKGTEQLVALKMLRHDWGGPEDVAQFYREVKAAARLRHPNRVRILVLGEHHGRPFYVMELIDGGSLAERLRDGQVTKADAVRYVSRVAEALAEAHQSGVVHRDVKPANVLIDARTDEAMLTDFGLAVLDGPAGPGPGVGQVVGTLHYAPPEQTLPYGVATPASDVYGLGATLYELLTGAPPLPRRPDESTRDYGERVRHEEPVPPRLRQAGVSREIDRICMKCLRKDPARRYRSALDLAGELRRYLGDVAYAGHFVNMGTLLLALAPAMLLSNVAAYFLIARYEARPDGWGEAAAWAVMFAMYPALFSAFALAPPAGGREHYLSRLELWSVWGGKMFAAASIGVALRAAFPESPQTAMRLAYVVFAALSGMAVFALVSKMSKRLYALPAGCWAVGVAMVWWLQWAPLLYGAYCLAGLTVYGTYLRRLGRELG